MSKTIVTHNGGFHADDVFAVATLMLIYPGSQVVRTRDESIISSADIVVDVGRIHDPSKMRFDHHQPGGAGVRSNGVPYASFGLVWKEYAEKLTNPEAALYIEQKLVMPIDALDNGMSVSKSLISGVREYNVSDYLYSFWVDSDVDETEIGKIFMQVVDLASNLIKREIDKANRIIRDEKIVEEIYRSSEDKRLIVMDREYAWGRVLVDKPEPLIVIYPKVENKGWAVQAVRKEPHSFETRISFPESWAGKSEGDLVLESGVEDAVFCHNKRFLAVAKSKEGALELARRALTS